MSQIIKNLASGPVPPSVATSYVTDNGTAIPLSNVLIVHASDSNIDVSAGIIANGGTPATANSNEVDIIITNRIRGTLTTTQNIPTVVNLFVLGTTPGVYNFDIQVVGFDVTDALGAGYFIQGAVRTDGSTGFLVGTPDKIVNEEPGNVACDAALIVSGNNAAIQVTGIAGKTIHWKYLSQYVFVS